MVEKTIEMKRDVKAERKAAARAFQVRLAAEGTFIVRLLSSPGAGKTSLLQETARRMPGRAAILVGDVETERDAERLAPYAPTRQITTGGACHLELPLVERALPGLADEPPEFLFIEDVGNLICPASHELGEHLRVILLSTTEGDDKPGKYPKAFRTSQVVVFTKLDLLPYVPFSVERATADALLVRSDLRFFPVAALRGQGVESWVRFLFEQRQAMLNQSGASEISC